MANHLSSKKRIRRNGRAEERNASRMSRVHTFFKKAETAIEGGDKQQAAEAFRVAESEMMRAVSKGVIHANTAARKVSRLSARVKAIAK